MNGQYWLTKLDCTMHSAQNTFEYAWKNRTSSALVFVQAGGLVFETTESGNILCSKGECVYVPKGASYFVSGKGDYCTLDFEMIQHGSTMPEENTHVEIFDKICWLWDRSGTLHKLFEKFYLCYSSCTMYDNISATAVFYRMILFLLHNRDEERTASIAVQARSFMEKELSYSTSIDVICAAVHVSRSILYEEFRKKYGCSPIKYNNKLVIIYAMDLLTNGRMSLQETSDRLGFSSKKQFSKVFQSVTGFTPTNYVRMHKIEYGKSFQIDSGSFYNKEEVQ